jgi:hypothetical protein
VGETWASQAVAEQGRKQKVDCITISETWTFEKAVIAEQYRPRWEWSAIPDDDEQPQRRGRTGVVEGMAKLALRLFTAFNQLRHEEVFSSRIKFAQACLNRLNKALREREIGPSDTETDAPAYVSEAEPIDKKAENIIEVDVNSIDADADDLVDDSDATAAESQTKEIVKNRGQSRLENQPKGAFLSLLSAKKGKPVPRFLWKVVEVMLVKWEGDVAWRVGTGKIAYDAWKAAFPIPRRVMLA